MPEPLVHPDPAVGWTVEDLNDIPDDGFRHEILDGNLLLSPPPDNHHFDVADLVADLLKRQTPIGVRASAAGAGVRIRGGHTYFIPDVIVVRQSGIRPGNGLQPADVLLVIEVLSPSNARTDLVLKRHDYAAEGIPAYWVVDPEKQTLTVLEHDGGEHYAEVAVVSPGDTFTTEVPFPISIDPAEIF